MIRPPETEKQFQAAVTSALSRWGWEWYHVYRSTRSKAGFPDILAVKHGQLMVLELKTDRGYVTASQRAWLALFAAIPGVIVRVLRPRDWEAFARDMNPRRRLKRVI